MADQQSRGGKKQGSRNPDNPTQKQHVQDESRGGKRPGEKSGDAGKPAGSRDNTGGRADGDESGENS